MSIVYYFFLITTFYYIINLIYVPFVPVYFLIEKQNYIAR